LWGIYDIESGRGGGRGIELPKGFEVTHVDVSLRGVCGSCNAGKRFKNSDFAMSTSTEMIEGLVRTEYKYGFVTDVEADAAPPGLSEEIVRFISRRSRSRSGCWSGG
jgi:hypothetical protein